MSIQYAGGTNVNTTFTGDTKANIIAAIQTHLTTAGWTVASGGGTTNLLMETAQTPQSLTGRFRFKDNGGNCVQVSIEDVLGAKASASNTTSGGNLLPGTAKTYRVIANRYQLFVFTPGASATREFVCGGVPHLPAFLEGVITQCIWMHGNSINDGDTSYRDSFRSVLGCGNQVNVNNAPNQAYLVNSNLWEQSNWGAWGYGHGRLVVPYNSVIQANNAYRWHDDSLIMSDPLLAWGLAASSDEAKIRGQLWDAVVIDDSFAPDLTTTFDSHSWFNITNSNVGGNHQKGSLWVVVP